MADSDFQEIIDDLREQLHTLNGQLDERDQDISRLQAQVRRLSQVAAEGGPQAAAPPAMPMGPPPAAPIDDVHTWVDEWLCQWAELTPSTSVRWCVRWFEHPEASTAIRQLHADFNRCMVNDSLGWQNYLRNSHYYWMPMLTSPNGPFAACSPERHEHLVHLPPTVLPADTPA